MEEGREKEDENEEREEEKERRAGETDGIIRTTKKPISFDIGLIARSGIEPLILP